VRQLEGRQLELEAISAAEASQGMTRQMRAYRYGHQLFIARRRAGYWQANLQQDWQETELGPTLTCHPVTLLELLDAHTQQPALGQLKNRFSWSYSRGAKYRGCPRAYYYHYYAAWEGWQPHAPEPVRRAYLLKNLTSIRQWVGTLVHEAIKFALSRLKAGQPVANDALLAQMRRRARTNFEDSQSGRYRQKPNEKTGFQEHYYGVSLADKLWANAWAEAEQYLRTFLDSALYAGLRRQPPHTFLDVETLQSFTVAGTKVWVQIDLARQVEGVIYLYDWKTGSLDESDLNYQMGIYGLYARQVWATANIRAVVYLLKEERLLEFTLAPDTLETVQSRVEADTARLQALLVDPPANLAALRRFPMIDDLSVCRRCQFRELCGRD